MIRLNCFFKNVIIFIVAVLFLINLHAGKKHNNNNNNNNDKEVLLKLLLSSIDSNFNNMEKEVLAKLKFFNKKERQIICNRLEKRVGRELMFMSTYPNFDNLNGFIVNPNGNNIQNINPYANNRIYIDSLDNLVTGDLVYLSRLYKSLKNKNDGFKHKRQEVIDALKSRAEKIIDLYPISKIIKIREIEDIGEMIAFTHHIRKIYEFTECTDFVVKEIEYRLKTLQRRNTPEVLLFPLKVILFSDNKLKTLDIRKNNRWERMIISTFIKDNSRVKLSLKQIEKLFKQ